MGLWLVLGWDEFVVGMIWGWVSVVRVGYGWDGLAGRLCLIWGWEWIGVGLCWLRWVFWCWVTLGGVVLHSSAPKPRSACNLLVSQTPMKIKG